MYRFDAELWLYPGSDPWHFLSLPGEISDEIRIRTSNSRRAFGSVGVHAAIGNTRWSTSLFPDKDGGTYLLPVKKKVRVHEELTEGESKAVAAEKADAARDLLTRTGVDIVDTRVGRADPYEAILAVLSEESFDEIIVSTFPPGVSRWLGTDLINRVKKTVDLPLTHVIAH